MRWAKAAFRNASVKDKARRNFFIGELIELQGDCEMFQTLLSPMNAMALLNFEPVGCVRI